MGTAIARSTRSELYREFVRISRYRIKCHYLVKLMTCLEALSEEELVKEPAPDCNSVASLTQHMLEGLRRALGHFDEGDRGCSAEFTCIEGLFPKQLESKEALIRRVTNLFDHLDDMLAMVQSADDPESIQSISMDRLYHHVEHMSYHIAQIILITRILTGQSFSFVKSGMHEAGLRRIIAALDADETQA